MKSVAEDIKDYLTSNSSLGLSFATNLFIGREPDLPDNSVTLFDMPGANPALNLSAANPYLYEAIQIRIRNTSYQTGYNLGQLITTYLNGKNNITINSMVYTAILVTQVTSLLDYDKNNRSRFIINLNIQRRI